MLKKVLAVFPVFILFAFSGLFVFTSPSSPVVFEAQPQALTSEQKQDRTWQWIKSELRNRYTYLDFAVDLKPLLAAAKDDTQYEKKGSELDQKVKDWLLLIFSVAKTKDKTGVLGILLGSQSSFLSAQKSRWNSLVDDSVGENHIDALLNPRYAYLAKTPILIKKEGKEAYNKDSLEPLFIAAKRFGVLKRREEFSKIKIPGFREMIWDFRFLSSVGESDINAAFAAADAKNKPKLNNLWTAIKDELKKPEYVYLVKTPILINNKNYDLKFLFEAAHSGFAGNGYALTLAAKMQLQDLVNANIDGENFKVALTAMNNQKLDDLWNQLKKILNQTEFDKWKDTSIWIKPKNYSLQLLFTNAKKKADVKGSALPLDAKLKLQELLADQVTSEMIENQLLALNQAEAEKNKQAEAEKNKQVKKKQQSQALTIGLATGGGVLVAAGVGGFLYWFFKIRKKKF